MTLAICLGGPGPLKEATEAGVKQLLGEMPWLKCSERCRRDPLHDHLHVSMCPVNHRLRGHSDTLSRCPSTSPGVCHLLKLSFPLYTLFISIPVFSQRPHPLNTVFQPDLPIPPVLATYTYSLVCSLSTHYDFHGVTLQCNPSNWKAAAGEMQQEKLLSA